MCVEVKDVVEFVTLRSEYGKQFTNDDGKIEKTIRLLFLQSK